METFFRKKQFLEIYIPIGLIIGPFLMMITGISLSASSAIGVVISMIGRMIYKK